MDHPGKQYITELLDHFEHDGPNGTYLCLVFPVMVSDGKEMVFIRNPRSIEYVRNVSEQILLGLDLLHEQGLVHCGKLLSPLAVILAMWRLLTLI